MSKKILVIEDEEILLGLLQKRLIMEGYEVSIAKDGKEGLKIMKEISPNLILLDIVMPKMDGIEVLVEMQKEDDLRRIPVIVISNSGQPVEIEKIKKLGVKDWLIKTEFDPQEIIQKVKKQIGD